MTDIKKAIWVKDVRQPYGEYGTASLYRLDPPLPYLYYDGYDNNIPGKAEYVVVSTTHAPGYWETYIFPADTKGRILDYGELEGSAKNIKDHEVVLQNAGYRIMEDN